MPAFIHRLSASVRALAGLLALGACLGALSAQETTAQYALVPDARSDDATTWRFTTDDPGAGWNGTEFVDGAWSSSMGGFGTGTAQGNAPIGQSWTTSDIWLRKTFELAAIDFEYLILRIQHDEDVEVYLNGTEILTESFIDGRASATYLPDAAKALLKPGSNVFALHCRNLDGPGYVDAGLNVTRLVQATTLVKDARFGGEAWKWTDAGTGAGWNDLGYEDADWMTGQSGFGTAEFAAFKGTDWTGYDIWIRKSFTVAKDFTDFILSYIHDDETEIYVNGKLIVQESGSGTEYKELTLAAAKIPVVKGENILAVRCTNSGGGPQFVDAGLIGLERPGTVGLNRRLAARTRANAERAPVLFSGRGAGPGAEKGAGKNAGKGARGVGFVDLSGLKPGAGARLEVYGLDGSLRASVRPVGQRAALPSSLGAGTFRYRWSTASGAIQGALISLP